MTPFGQTDAGDGSPTHQSPGWNPGVNQARFRDVRSRPV